MLTDRVLWDNVGNFSRMQIARSCLDEHFPRYDSCACNFGQACDLKQRLCVRGRPLKTADIGKKTCEENA